MAYAECDYGVRKRRDLKESLIMRRGSARSLFRVWLRSQGAPRADGECEYAAKERPELTPSVITEPGSAQS